LLTVRVRNLNWRLQGDNRPISVYANNCKSPDLVRVRGVLYYSSAGFFLLQLEQACSSLPSACGPADRHGGSYRVGRQQSRRMGPRIVESTVGHSAPRPAEAGIVIGTLRSLVVKNITIGIEAPLTTTPENGHRLAMYDSVGFVKAIFSALGRKNCVERRRCGEAGVKGAFFAFISTLDTAFPTPQLDWGSNVRFFLRFDP
jgi:hypothetical protein